MKLFALVTNQVRIHSSQLVFPTAHPPPHSGFFVFFFTKFLKICFMYTWQLDGSIAGVVTRICCIKYRCWLEWNSQLPLLFETQMLELRVHSRREVVLHNFDTFHVINTFRIGLNPVTQLCVVNNTGLNSTGLNSTLQQCFKRTEYIHHERPQAVLDWFFESKIWVFPTDVSFFLWAVWGAESWCS